MEVLILVVLFLASILILLRSSGRSSVDVIIDLTDDNDEVDNSKSVKSGLSLNKSQRTQKDEYFQAGLINREEQRRFESKMKTVPFYSAIIFGLILFLAFSGNILLGIFGFFTGLCGGYLYLRRSLYLKKRRFLRDIEFFLPIVMERLVMAAQAGLDVFSGLRVVSDLEIEAANSAKYELDPVTKLLERAYKLSEKGVGFEEALRQIADKIDSPPLRHAFIHLSVAQKDGGELISPLRELSDSTHAYFEETIEEEIARLPVKATIPLLVTFAGLIIFFLTSPIIQIMKLTSQGVVQ